MQNLHNQKTSNGVNKKLITLIIAGLVIFGLVALLRLSKFGVDMVWQISNGGSWLLPLVLVSAVIDSINPCAFSILLLTIAFLFNLGRKRSEILKIGGLYIFGLFLVYILIGLGILQALHLFNTPHFMAKVGALLLLVLGLVNLINEFFPKFPIKLKIPNFAHHKMAELMERGSMLTAFILGILVGLCEFPCTGGPYLMILGLLHDKTTYIVGFGYLLLYNVIFVLPLGIILSIAANNKVLGKFESWKKTNMKNMRFWGGILMIGLGLLIFYL